ncbi:hypothetical protein DBR06_SOUSAS33710039, partial [Sousa chinensis]
SFSDSRGKYWALLFYAL